MNFPGFTAEASSHEGRTRVYLTSPFETGVLRQITPQNGDTCPGPNCSAGAHAYYCAVAFENCVNGVPAYPNCDYYNEYCTGGGSSGGGGGSDEGGGGDGGGGHGGPHHQM